MKSPILIAIIVLLVLLGGFFLVRQSGSTKVITPVVTPTASIPITGTPNTNTLEQGGASFLDPSGVFNILYPSDYKLDTTDSKHPRIYKQGATQKGQTEMYDGVLIVFETVNLNGANLNTWTDNYIKTLTTDGSVEITKAKQATTLNGFPGFTFKARGLGESTYYVVEKDSNSQNAVLINYSVNDPQNVGFQTQVDTTLATLQLLK